MAMSKRDESNKEKTTSSYNLPSTQPIPPSATTINTSQLASTTTTIANTYQPSNQFPNNEGPRATSHLPLSDPRSTNQGLKNDAQAVADLLALFDASTNSPPSFEETPRPHSFKRPPTPPSPPDAAHKKRRLTPPATTTKKLPRTPTGEQSIQFVQYSPKPPQPKRKPDVILDEPTHSTPSPGIIVSQSTRPSASHTAITTSFQPPHMRAASYTQISTIAPGPFSPTAAPQLYVPHIPPPMSLPPVPAPTNIVPQSPMIMSPWPAVTPTSYQIPPTLPPQQYFTGPPLSLEQLMHQRLQHINYPSGIEYRLIKNCLPDQPLNFFKTNVPSQAPVPRAEPPEQLRPFKEPTSEVSAEIIQSLPHLPQLIQTLEVPFEAQRSTATQAETTRGPPKKLPLHLVQ
jgi:hypothetical protein